MRLAQKIKQIIKRVTCRHESYIIESRLNPYTGKKRWMRICTDCGKQTEDDIT